MLRKLNCQIMSALFKSKNGERQLEVKNVNDDKDDRDNHSDQLNPNNEAYWESRGEDERPDDWEERSQEY